MRCEIDECSKRRNSRCRLAGAILLTVPLGLAILLSAGAGGGGGDPASTGGGMEGRGEITPLDSDRTLDVHAHQDDDWGYCDESDDDAAEGFEDYDNTIEVQCSYGVGRASQQSSIRSIFLTADGYAYASGATGMGHDQWGDAESVFEVVFDSPVNQWCSLSGFISTTCDDMAGGNAVARLTGPDNVVLVEIELSWENNAIEFSEGILLVEGGRYTLRVEAHAFACDSSAESEYSVLLDPTGYVPAVDVGVYSVNSPQPEFPVGECTIAATIANYGSEDQQTPVHCDVFGQDVTFLDEDFEGDFPPAGWQQEQEGEWLQSAENKSGGAAPVALLESSDVVGDYAYLEAPPVDTTSADRLILEFKHHLYAYWSGAVARVLTRSSPDDDWTEVSPWENPPLQRIGPNITRIDISHDIGAATQVRFEAGGDGSPPRYWHVNDIRIYDVNSVYSSDAVVTVPAISEVEVEFEPPWEAPEELFLLEAFTDLPGDENPGNDARTEMISAGPVTRNEDQQIVAGYEYDWFGCSVDIDGHVAIVGAHEDTKGKGYAAILDSDGSSWVYSQKLVASDPQNYQRFGCSVSIDNDTAVVGARKNDNQNGDSAGCAYVFVSTGSYWSQAQKLTASDGAEKDYFGKAVAVAGELAVIGAPSDDDHGPQSGSAYVFRYDGSTWVEEQKLTASDGAEGDYFGDALAIQGDVAVVGGRGAYVFRYDNGTWVEEAKLEASDSDGADGFGYSVAIEGQRIVVGAYADDDLGFNCGSAYVFQLQRGAWVEEAKLVASDGWVNHALGSSVAINGDTIAVGAFGHYADYDFGGCAYMFVQRDSEWVQAYRLLASDTYEGDEFGTSIAVDDGQIIVGAEEYGTGEGAVYLFTGSVHGDVNGDGVVDIDDIFAILAAWGPCDDCPEDVNGDGMVDIDDLFEVLANWT